MAPLFLGKKTTLDSWPKKNIHGAPRNEWQTKGKTPGNLNSLQSQRLTCHQSQPPNIIPPPPSSTTNISSSTSTAIIMPNHHDHATTPLEYIFVRFSAPPPPAKHLLRLAHGENLGMDAACCCNKRYSKMYLLVVWKSYTSKPKHTHLANMNTYDLWTYANHSVQTHWTMVWYTVFCRDIHILYSSFLYSSSSALKIFPCTLAPPGSGQGPTSAAGRNGTVGVEIREEMRVANDTWCSEPFFFGKFMVEMSAPRLGTNLHWNIYVKVTSSHTWSLTLAHG